MPGFDGYRPQTICFCCRLAFSSSHSFSRTASSAVGYLIRDALTKKNYVIVGSVSTAAMITVAVTAFATEQHRSPCFYLSVAKTDYFTRLTWRS